MSGSCLALAAGGAAGGSSHPAGLRRGPGYPAAWLRAVAWASLWVLSSCATRPAPDVGQPWISGRLSVRVEASADRPASSVSADFDLRGDHARGELVLSSPLGTRIAEARWAPGDVVLATGQGESRYADLDALSREALGEVLPLRAFPDWLAGRPWSEAPRTERQDGFEQLGWQVKLDRWAEGWVQAVRMTPPIVDVRARLQRSP